MKSEDTIQRQLLKRIRDWFQVLFEIEALEKEKSDLTDDELLENREYGNLLEQSAKLRNAIISLLVQAKFFPLIGLSDKQSGVLKILYGHLKDNKNIKQKDIEYVIKKSFYDFHSDFVRRAVQVEPLFLVRHLDWRADKLYQEVINCYMYGSFHASCVLCRAIAESIAKQFVESSGHRDWLVDKDGGWKNDSIRKVIKRKQLAVPEEIHELYSEIAVKANKILHQSDEKATEDDALETIKLIQSFINKFPIA